MSWVGRGAVALVALTAVGGGYWYLTSRPQPVPPIFIPPPPKEATSEQVHQFCGTACHAYPPPASFPRWAWR